MASLIFDIKNDKLNKENLLKIKIIEKYNSGNLSTFVETGTASATTAILASEIFKSVYTIDINFDFYLSAVEKTFRLKNVFPLYGDSPLVLNSLLFAIDEPSVILLDAHDVGDGIRGTEEAPILKELETIFPSNKHTYHPHLVLIDDARLLDSNPEYPTFSQIKDFAERIGYEVVLDSDILVLKCLK